MTTTNGLLKGSKRKDEAFEDGGVFIQQKYQKNSNHSSESWPSKPNIKVYDLKDKKLKTKDNSINTIVYDT